MKAFFTILTWIVGALLICLGFLFLGIAAYAVSWLMLPFKINKIKPQK
jgi:phage shock protein PspC (stress-responsive transcriptional regulator)